MSTHLITLVADAWGWTGIAPAQIVGDNPFGNLMIEDHGGCYWRLCPEDLYCTVIAQSRAELDALARDQDFLQDWYMAALVQQAGERLGPLQPGHAYCLKIPGALGGEYGGDNLATVPLAELICASGSMAQQIDGLPEGAQVKLSVVE